MDKNYAERVSLRRSLLRDHPSTVHGHIPPGRPAIRELYTFLLSTYLPARYPSMFRLSSSGDTFHNLVTGAEFPTTPPEDMSSALGILCETVEDDLFLLRETDEGPHIVDAFVCCFPAGFDPSEKLGLLLKDVHGPVPSYEKIGASMERFFGRLETGKSVKRMNVSHPCFPLSILTGLTHHHSGPFRRTGFYSTPRRTRSQKTRSPTRMSASKWTRFAHTLRTPSEGPI